MDPFDVLGLAPTFDLDEAALLRAYLKRSALLHPDLARGDPEAPRAMAALNHARAALADPERRASVLLSRLGGPSREQDRSLPAGFLMEIMETRQEIESAIASGDAAERGRWEAWAQARRSEAVAEVGALFRGLPARPSAPELGAIRTRLNAWRYVERLIEQLDPDYDPARADLRDA